MIFNLLQYICFLLWNNSNNLDSLNISLQKNIFFRFSGYWAMGLGNESASPKISNWIENDCLDVSQCPSKRKLMDSWNNFFKKDMIFFRFLGYWANVPGNESVSLKISNWIENVSVSRTLELLQEKIDALAIENIKKGLKRAGCLVDSKRAVYSICKDQMSDVKTRNDFVAIYNNQKMCNHT